MPKPLASISLDLDNLWAYMKNHGSPGWESHPSYFNIFVPQILEELDRRGLTITFFIVGQDAVVQENRQYLRMIAQAGHEIANHSYKHDTWLHRYTAEEIGEEVNRSHRAIEEATGEKPLGFRGPGFTWSNELLKALATQGYQYDASTFPTFIGPLARKLYYRSARLTKKEREERKDLFGKFSDGFKPVKPFTWKLENNMRLLEIPVTTMPVFKIPIHLTYLVFLASKSRVLMKVYLNIALMLCRLTRTSPSFLIHPLDLMGNDQVRGLETFPGMEVPSAKKVEIFRYVLDRFGRYFSLVPMIYHAKAAMQEHRPVHRVKMDISS